jgi:diaminopropionate ammonia-lyase
MKIINNRFRGQIDALTGMDGIPWPSDDADRPAALLQRCPSANATPLLDVPHLAVAAGVGKVSVKDERGRMGLGSFKALGAAYVIARDAEEGRAKGQTYVTASAGNHGLSVAAGAAAFGAVSVIYLSETVPQDFAMWLEDIGATVVRAGDNYEASQAAAVAAAADNGWTLLSDTSWHGYTESPRILMEGYLVLMQEAVSQLASPPTHIILQAGVGGLAVACGTYARKVWGAEPKIIVVEPEYAPAIFASIEAGSAQETSGPVSDMGRLDCKEPSLIALQGLGRDADRFMTITEDEGFAGQDLCEAAGIPASTSGAAGVAGLIAGKADLGLSTDSHVLCILSEGV